MGQLADLNSYSRASTITFNRGQEIFRPGHGEGFIYIVRSGYVRLYKSLPDGRSINLGLLGPGTVFTQEVDPDGLSSGSSAEALVDASVAVVEANELADLIQREPELASAVVQGMSRRLSEMHMGVYSVAATYEGVTVTRKLLELQEQGAVRSLGRNSIAVSPERLLAHAQAATTQEELYD